ncbi:MAG: hypothetical protein E7496_08600 [Ruminococcus sp.]|nr:hypothetical protein [Ruminococcus sp.]
MKKEDIQRMLSQVDEKYISELTEAEFPSDVEYADEVSGEVEVVKHISHWRNWTAAAAALIVCVGLGAFLIRPAIQHSQFQVGDSAGCYDFIDSLTEEELDKYFLNQIENLPDFPLTKISDPLPKEITNPVIGKNMFDNMNILFSEMHDYAEFHAVSQGNYAVIARVWDNPPELDCSQAEAYHIDGYDVDFYGAYFQAVSEPMPVSQSFFSYHGKLYHFYTDTLSKKEIIRLVYEILDSDFSAKSLWLEYGMTEEDFVPYFTELDGQDSNLNYYDEDILHQLYGNDYKSDVDNIAPLIAEKWFTQTEHLFLSDGADKSAKFNMGNNEHTLLLSIYDNSQIDMNTFTSLTPYHLDDYDIDFYGLHKFHDDNPIQNSTMGIFQYHDKLYILNLTDFTRQETMKLVYEILNSDLSAESLYQQYCGDFVSMEDSRITTLEEANQIEFCKGMIPQLDILTGENEQINGRNLGMDGEYVYDNLYDDSDLLLDKDSMNYHQNEDGEQLSYSYSNPECNLNVLYTSFLPDNVNLAEHYSSKITLQYPFSTPVDGQNENSRLRYWDFWLDLGSCYVNLNGLCSMNQEDAFINGLNHILIGQEQEENDKSQNLDAINTLDDLCKNLIPQMVTVGDMKFDRAEKGTSPTENSLTLYYESEDGQKGFTVNYSDLNLDLIDIAVPALTAGQLTEEGLANAGIFTEYQGLFIDCQRCLIDISFTNCTKEEMMPYLTELKNLIEKYDSENTDLQQFNQNELWGGLVPEIQNIGSLEFQRISLVSPDDADALDYQVLYQEKNNPEHKITVTYSYGDNIQSIVGAKLGILEEVPVYGGDGSARIFEFHAGKFFIEIETVNCTQEEIDLYLNATETLLDKNYHASGAILEYLNQQEFCRNQIPEISGMNDMIFTCAVTNLTLDENAPEIEITYANEENPERKLICKFTKTPQTEATPLTIEEIDGNLQIEPGQYEHFELLIDCYGWYAWIVGENCYKEDLDCYTMALAETYKANH